MRSRRSTGRGRSSFSSRGRRLSRRWARPVVVGHSYRCPRDRSLRRFSRQRLALRTCRRRTEHRQLLRGQRCRRRARRVRARREAVADRAAHVAESTECLKCGMAMPYAEVNAHYRYWHPKPVLVVESPGAEAAGYTVNALRSSRQRLDAATRLGLPIEARAGENRHARAGEPIRLPGTL